MVLNVVVAGRPDGHLEAERLAGPRAVDLHPNPRQRLLRAGRHGLERVPNLADPLREALRVKENE
jgi:hypothetical protein